MKIFLLTGDRAYAERLAKILGQDHPLVIFGLAEATDSKAEEQIGQNLVLLDVGTRDPGKWPDLVRNLADYFHWRIVVVDRRAHWRRAYAAFNSRAVGYLSKAWRPAVVKLTLQNSAAAPPPE